MWAKEARKRGSKRDKSEGNEWIRKVQDSLGDANKKRSADYSYRHITVEVCSLSPSDATK